MFPLRSSASKLIVSNVPNNVHPSDLEVLFNQFGNITNIDKLNSRDGSAQTIAVIFESPEQAQQ